MNQAIPFDTLAYANKLKAAGVPERQAEVQAEAIAALVNEQMATKHDLARMETDLRRDMKEIEANLRRDMKEIEANVRHNMKEMETSLRHEIEKLRLEVKQLEMRLIIRLGAIMAFAVSLLAVLVELL